MDPNAPIPPSPQTPPQYAPPVAAYVTPAPQPPYLAAPPPAPNGGGPQNKKPRVWLWVVIGGGAFFAFLLAVFLLIYFSVKSDNNSADFSGFGEKIAVVDIEGVIIEPRTVVKQLKKYGDDDSVKAIILHMDTPGGGVAASQEIYTEVKRIREEKKKRVVTSIETVGASGGYYIASASDKIFANPGSVVGSIGVIAEWFNYEELVKWAKLKPIIFKTGEFKDTGTPTRELTPREKEYLQGLINDMYGQFMTAVSEGRKMKLDEVKALADGRVWTGKQGKELKLIDEVGDFQACVADTAKSVGIRGEPTLVHPEPQRRTLADVLFGDISQFLPAKGGLLETHVGFYYLWK
ncbi:MAG: signal peptide peptidase SppA [Candidatus Koribacter versatilis]|uniref:Signal peptide peptidase SppA n=1 Tax=Candidatus Korobacter versatilis TaxID=658062 RepID=A0A932A978_9BACT|nr:signal peptide peptidase SppA [Candidatus Koribacter versatilis]